MKNQLLAQTEQKIEAGLQPDTKANYDKVVMAGMRAALHGGPKSILASLKTSKNPIHDCVVGAFNLALILRKQSRNTMPVKALIPGATVLMLHALDFAEAAGIVKIDKPELDQATHLLANTILQRFGLTPNMLHTAATKVHALSQNPVSMARMRLAAGMDKDPRAASPTPMPAEPDEAEAE